MTHICEHPWMDYSTKRRTMTQTWMERLDNAPHLTQYYEKQKQMNQRVDELSKRRTPPNFRECITELQAKQALLEIRVMEIYDEWLLELKEQDPNEYGHITNAKLYFES